MTKIPSPTKASPTKEPSKAVKVIYGQKEQIFVYAYQDKVFLLKKEYHIQRLSNGRKTNLLHW